MSLFEFVPVFFCLNALFYRHFNGYVLLKLNFHSLIQYSFVHTDTYHYIINLFLEPEYLYLQIDKTFWYAVHYTLNWYILNASFYFVPRIHKTSVLLYTVVNLEAGIKY